MKRRWPIGGRPHQQPEYTCWRGMLSRCYCPTNTNYKNYGGRGITVCDCWRESYGQFLADMGTRPSPKHSIDRIDVNGNYDPVNCRWATPREQANNKRPVWAIPLRELHLAIKGEKRSFKAWTAETGIGVHHLGARLRSGWTTKRALTTPVRGAK